MGRQPLTQVNHQPQILLLNRMWLGIAHRVKQLILEVFGVVPGDLDEIEEIPEDGVDVLLVGRQHHDIASDRIRWGYDIVEEAVRRGQPEALIYVIPSVLRPELHQRDLLILSKVAKTTPVMVLEFDRLHTMEMAEAAKYAKQAILNGIAGKQMEPTMLLPQLGPVPHTVSQTSDIQSAVP